MKLKLYLFVAAGTVTSAVQAQQPFATTTLVTFDGTNGRQPCGRLVQAADGNFYGTTYNGGPGDAGTVFRMSPSGALATLFRFGTNRAVYGFCPAGPPVQGGDGNLYITTCCWPPLSGMSGTVLRMNPSGEVSVLVSFSGTNGDTGGYSLCQGSRGELYGATAHGGSGYNGSATSGDGTVYAVTPAGHLTVLHSFSGADGCVPLCGLIFGADGNLYGMADHGGIGYAPAYNDNNTGNGTIFKVTPSGTFTLLYSFTGGADGANPQRPLVGAADGNFYGTAAYGGANGCGTVFKMTPAGILTTLYSFSGRDDGANPVSELLGGTDGNFYGTTSAGGAAGSGTVFRITLSGTLTTLYSFTGRSDGAKPLAGLMRASDGNFYGTTSAGGALGAGTIFRFSAPPAPPASANIRPTTNPPAGGASASEDGTRRPVTTDSANGARSASQERYVIRGVGILLLLAWATAILRMIWPRARSGASKL